MDLIGGGVRVEIRVDRVRGAGFRYAIFIIVVTTPLIQTKAGAIGLIATSTTIQKDKL